MKLEPKTDGKPTLSSWPVRIWDKSEIKPEYMPFLDDLFENGLELEHLIFVPAFLYTHEYMMAVTEGQVRIISKGKTGELTCETVKAGQLLYIKHVIELLYSRIDFYWFDGQKLHCSSAAFNRTTLDLFLPAIHTLLGLPFNFSCDEAESRENRPDKLFSEDYALYQYSINAYRMGDRLKTYYRRFVKMSLLRRLKRHEPTRILSCPMEKGLFIQVLDVLFTSAFYCPWRSVSSSSDYSSYDTDSWAVNITDGLSRSEDKIVKTEIFRLDRPKE